MTKTGLLLCPCSAETASDWLAYKGEAGYRPVTIEASLSMRTPPADDGAASEHVPLNQGGPCWGLASGPDGLG